MEVAEWQELISLEFERHRRSGEIGSAIIVRDKVIKSLNAFRKGPLLGTVEVVTVGAACRCGPRGRRVLRALRRICSLSYSVHLLQVLEKKTRGTARAERRNGEDLATDRPQWECGGVTPTWCACRT